MALFDSFTCWLLFSSYKERQDRQPHSISYVDVSVASAGIRHNVLNDHKYFVLNGHWKLLTVQTVVWWSLWCVGLFWDAPAASSRYIHRFPCFPIIFTIAPCLIPNGFLIYHMALCFTKCHFIKVCSLKIPVDSLHSYVAITPAPQGVM